LLLDLVITRRALLPLRLLPLLVVFLLLLLLLLLFLLFLLFLPLLPPRREEVDFFPGRREVAM